MNLRLLLLYIASILFFTWSAAAETVRVVPNGKLAVATWLSELASARKSIDIVTFSLDPCSTMGHLVIDELARKAANGVRVRVLIDGYEMYHDKRAALVATLEKRDIAVRVYNNSFFAFSIASNLRMHSKFVVIDDRKYIVGSRNIEDRHFGLSERLNFVDRDLVVEGPSVRQAVRSFWELWTSPMSEDLGAPSSYVMTEFESTCLRETKLDGDVRRLVARERRALIDSARQVKCPSAEFVADRSDFSSGLADDEQIYLSGERYVRKTCTRSVVDFLNGAERNLMIENWLYIPSHKIDAALTGLRRRGVKINLFTNEASDVEHVANVSKYFQIRDNIGSQRVHAFSEYGALEDIWDLTPQTPMRAKWFLHSKVIVADGKHSLVGSFNLDPRSYATNLESSVIFRNCRALANALVEEMRPHEALIESDRTCDRCAKSRTKPAAPGSADWLLFEFLQTK